MKPKPREIESDKCAVAVGGETCYPHEGEHVTMFVGQTVGELSAVVRLQRLGARFPQGAEGDGAQAAMGEMEAVFREILGHLAQRIVSWDWTDDAGRPLPPPVDAEGQPLGLLKLRAPEVLYLLEVSDGSHS